ncbi:MAG: hypothetical protein H0V09_11845 [Gemmatimonadetes bacterium]|nr:hypothetical protein [Gemmatimonadota bacterium]
MDLLRTASLTALAVAALTSCSAFRDKDGRPETRAGAPAASGGRRTERTATAAPPAPADVRTPERTDTGAESPKRHASESLVEEGKGYWIAGRDREARERFEQALVLDGSNGVAYYYLAEIAVDAGRWDEAAGYRDRAAALLRGRETYREPLAELARRIAERR